MFRRIWIPGLQYQGETTEQMEAREARLREMDAACEAEQKRLAEWKARPWWQDSETNHAS